MTDSAGYRVLTRRQLVLGLAAVAALLALALWLGIRWSEAYAATISRLVQASPEAAAATLERDLRVLAAVNGAAAWAVAGFLVWQGRRALRARMLPPPGSWIVEGQRLRTGREAVAASRLLIFLAGALALLGAGLSVLLWSVAGRLPELVGLALPGP
jgi:hypothetical protein